MTDVHDKFTRSYNMSRIKGSDTKPELTVRRFLYAKGLRYRLNVKKLPGTPDLVFARYKAVVFVHGCFWHAHKGCRYFKLPVTRRDWWKEKLEGTKKRDQEAIEELQRLGWRVAVIWECQLKGKQKGEHLTRLYQWVKNQKNEKFL